MDFYTESCDVFLFEFASQVTLDEGGLALGSAGGLEIFECIACQACSGRICDYTCNI